MLLQEIKIKAEQMKTAVLFGEGDISVGLSKGELCGKPVVCVTLEQLEKSKKIGEKISEKDTVKHDSRVVLIFDNIDSIRGVTKQLFEARKMLDAAIKNDGIEFTVPIKKVIIPTNFQLSNPTSSKIMDCYGYYKEHGEFDRKIIVDKNLRLNDGYVAYVVAEYLGMKEIPVVVKDGISIKIADNVMMFASDEVHVSISFIGIHVCVKFMSGIQESSVGVDTLEETIPYFKKINNVFKARFVIEKLPETNLDFVKRLNDMGISAYARLESSEE